MKNMGTEATRKMVEEKGLRREGDPTSGKNQMMMNVLSGKGSSDLNTLREETKQKRYRIAEEHATYNATPEVQEKIRQEKLKQLSADINGDKAEKTIKV